VKLPVCNFDAKTGILCANCESRLRRGEISDADVRASRIMVSLPEKSPEFEKFTLRRAADVDGSYLLEMEEADMDVLRRNPELRTKLDKAFGGRVWAVAAGGDDRRFLEDVLFPAKVLTVNTVWLPDGRKRTKVIVPAKRSERKLGDFDKLRDAVKQARGIELLVETEREARLR
jgi:transcription antitermination factor NusA-like protein